VVKPDDQATRSRILAAAGELIVEVGWANVTTRLIAERAGVNNALIHYYYGSKDDLLLQAAGAALAEEGEGLLSLVSDGANVADALKAVFDWVLAVDTHAPSMVVAMEATHRAVRDERIGEFVQTIWGGYVDTFASAIAEAQRDGDMRPDLDPSGLALVLGALMDGLFLYRLVIPDPEMGQASAVVRRLIDLLTEGNK